MRTVRLDHAIQRAILNEEVSDLEADRELLRGEGA